MNQIDAKLKQKTKLGQLEIRELKNKLKFSLNKDVQMPLETKKSHQVLCHLIKQKNRVTGEERVIVKKVRAIDYEFDCESLSDFAY